MMAKMRDIPVNDFYAKNGKVREDGRMVHDMYFVPGQEARRIRPARGTTTRSCRPFRAIKLLSVGRRRLPAGQTAISGCAATTCFHRSLMKEVMTHA